MPARINSLGTRSSPYLWKYNSLLARQYASGERSIGPGREKADCMLQDLKGKGTPKKKPTAGVARTQK